MKKTQKHKIIITIEGNIKPSEALELVKKVVEHGKVSEADGIKHYCWATTFDRFVVVTLRKETADSADSFIVFK